MALTRPGAERLPGASALQRRLFDALRAHEEGEREVVAAYEGLVGRTSSQTVRYLVAMIVEDERRHHRVLRELVNTVRAEATLEERGARVPFLDVHRGDRDLLGATHRFLEVERRDRAELEGLARLMRSSGGSPLTAFVVRLLAGDSARHVEILEFLDRQAR